MKRYGFKKTQILRTNEEFRAVLAHKCCASKRLIRMYVAGNATETPRFGVSVTKNCGSAVLRNRLKRLAREAFRLEQYNIPAGFDYLLIFTGKMSKKLTLSGRSVRGRYSLQELREHFLEMAGQAVEKSCKNQRST